MKITKLLKSECTDTDYVFETNPPLTQEVLTEFNSRSDESIRQYAERNGKLIITRKQLQDMRQGDWSRKPVDVLSDFLTQAEDKLTKKANEEKRQLESRTAETAAFFGVPLD